MTAVTVNLVDGQNDMLPPCGTAIVRPVRHVRAVRECHARRFADAAEAATSRSARAWAWALDETTIAPVTDQQTTVPPSRSDIEAQIAEADQRRLRGDRENRADAAAKILRWLIGGDDHVPARCENPGELVGGFGDVVRSPEEIAKVLTVAVEEHRRESGRSRDDVAVDDRRHARRDTDYFDGVIATLAWILRERADSPITHAANGQPTTRGLKLERVHAEDAIEARSRRADLPSPSFGRGVKSSISWLLGDSPAWPVAAAAST